MSCPNCGSWSVKADRSLGGRMVCGRCGHLLGGQVIPLRRRSRRPALAWPRRQRLWWWTLGALLGVSGLLAALDSPRDPWRTPTRAPWGQGQNRQGSLAPAAGTGEHLQAAPLPRI